jgi:hypothetical protein
MSERVAAALVAALEAAAASAWREEEALRHKMAAEVARLERRRAFAHRRMNLVRTLVAPITAAETEEAAASAQRAAARREHGWEREGDYHRAILDRLQPVGIALWRSVRGAEDATPSATLAELEAFETWFETNHKEPFYALFDRAPPEVGLVET